MSAVGESAAPADAGALTGVSRSFGALMAGELVSKALRFAAAAVLARGLSPTDYGLFNVGIAVSGVLVVLTTLGLPEVAGRRVANHHGEAPALGGMVATVRVAATLALGAVGLVVLELAWPGHLGYGLAIVAMSVAMSATADWLGRALERMRTVAVGAAAGGVAAMLGAVAVVTLTSGSAAAGLAAFVVAEAVATLVYWTAVRGRPRFGVRGLGPLLRRSWPVALSSAAIYSYYANLDTIIMAATRTESEAGVYSAAYRLYLTICIVGVFAAYAAFPRLSRVPDLRRIERLLATLVPTLRYVLAYGVLVVACACLFGRLSLEVLFGERFGAAEETLTLLCLSAAWYCVGFPVGYNLVAAERNRRFLAGALTGAGLNLLLDLILIPPHGLIGAGIATTASSIAAVGTWLGLRGVLSAEARPFLVVLTAVSGAVIAALLADDARPFVGVALAVAALARLAFLTLEARRTSRAA